MAVTPSWFNHPISMRNVMASVNHDLLAHSARERGRRLELADYARLESEREREREGRLVWWVAADM